MLLSKLGEEQRVVVSRFASIAPFTYIAYLSIVCSLKAEESTLGKLGI